MGYNMEEDNTQEKIFGTQISGISQIELRVFLDRINRIHWIFVFSVSGSARLWRGGARLRQG